MVTQPDTVRGVVLSRLRELGWRQRDLAAILGKTNAALSDLLNGKRTLTPDWADLLSAALGDDPIYWLSLGSTSRLPSSEIGPVRRRSAMYQQFPVRDMISRGWISATNDMAELETELCRFVMADSLENLPSIAGATRKSSTLALDGFTPAQRAWCFRARQLGEALKVSAFRPNRSTELKKELRELAAYPSEAKYVPEVLGRHGIRFVVIEQLPGTRIDGLALWATNNCPVIALSLRIDRLDSFWFTLMHELSHIFNEDAISLDVELTGEVRTPSEIKLTIEQRADAEAAASLVDPSELRSFVRRIGPLYSKPHIVGFAHRIKIHPGIIIGQLQHLGELGWGAFRDMLPGIRKTVAPSALTDGWGYSINPTVFARD